jgi:hypothetical protein
VNDESWNRCCGISEGEGAAFGRSLAERVSLPKIGHVAMKGVAGATTVKRRASAILRALEEVDAQLVGKAVVLADGKAGTVGAIWLDEVHGLRVSITGHFGKWPVSTIKFAQS